MIGVVNADFVTDAGRHIRHALVGVHHRLLSDDELREIEAQCEARTAACAVNDDGLAVFTLRPFGDELELFVLLAIAFQHGAFARQESALRSIARDLGATTIAFETRRIGWARRLGPQWQRRGTREFVRPVDVR